MKVTCPNVFLQRLKKTEKNKSTTVSKREYIFMSVIL